MLPDILTRILSRKDGAKLSLSRSGGDKEKFGFILQRRLV